VPAGEIDAVFWRGKPAGPLTQASLRSFLAKRS
jgi:hypothetical protein